MMTYYHLQANRIAAAVFPAKPVIMQVAAARKLMDSRFHENIKLDYICREACLSKYHFARLFKRLYGRTPYQYLTEKKMQAAHRLLTAGESVTATAMLVGFNSTTSFSAAFRAYFHAAPRTKKSKIG